MEDLYFQQLKCFNDCHDRSFTLPAQQGTGYFRSVCPRKGMLLYLEDYRLKRDMPVNVGSMYRPLLNLCYCISGRVDWTINSTAEPFITKGGNCEMFMTCFSSGAGTHCAGKPLVMVNIMIYPELLQSYFDAPLDLMCRLDMKKLPVTGAKAVYHKYKIPGFMYRILKQVMQSPCLRPADRLRTQSMVLELVAYHLERLDTPAETPKVSRDVNIEIDLVNQAKSILKSRMQSPPSLRHLAQLLGTNETKLKRSFKAECGTTVYGYLTSRRMQIACDLLKDENLTMSHIGHDLGYSERTHFSRAFSRYYGISPSQYRLKLQQLTRR